MEKVFTFIIVVLALILVPGTFFWLLYNVTGFSNSFDLPEIGWWQSVVGLWIIGLVGAAFNSTNTASK